MNEFSTVESPLPQAAPRAGLLQFVKFCTVGVSSTIVDKGVLWLLMSYFMPNTPKAICSTISFALGVSNGFFWNRRWTFQAPGAAPLARSAYFKFFFVNVIGLLLNLSFTVLFQIPFAKQIAQSDHMANLYWLGASLCAAPIVVFWNFFANKHWTFKATS